MIILGDTVRKKVAKRPKFAEGHLEMNYGMIPWDTRGFSELPQINLFGVPDLNLSKPRRHAPTYREQLFAYLALQDDGKAQRSQIISALGIDNENGKRLLRSWLSELRKDLEQSYGRGFEKAVSDNGDPVQLNISMMRIDVADFLQYSSAELSDKWWEARSKYKRGRLLDGWTYQWCNDARALVHKKYVALLKRLLIEASKLPNRRKLTLELLSDLQEAQPDDEQACLDLADYQQKSGLYKDAWATLESFKNRCAAPTNAFLERELRLQRACISEDEDQGLTEDMQIYLEGVYDAPDNELIGFALSALLEVGENAVKTFEGEATLHAPDIRQRLEEKVSLIHSALEVCSGSPGRWPVGLRLAQAILEYWSATRQWRLARRPIHRLLEATKGKIVSAARARVLNKLGVFAVEEGDYDTAYDLLQEAFAVCSQILDMSERSLTSAHIHNSIAYYYQYRSTPDLAAAEKYLLLSLSEFAYAGNEEDAIWPNLGMGNLRIAQSRPGEAKRYLQKCIEVGSHRRAVAYAHHGMAQIAAFFDQNIDELDHLLAELTIFYDLRDAGGIASALDCLAGWAATRHEWCRAAKISGASTAWREHKGVPRWEWEHPKHRSLIEVLESQLCKEQYVICRDSFIAMPDSLPEVVRIAGTPSSDK